MRKYLLGLFLCSTAAHASTIDPNDYKILCAVADEYKLTCRARDLLYAIYKAENGKPGIEMGILARQAQRYKGNHAKSLRLQAQWAAGTIKKRFTGDLEAFAARYCPVGASNDPKGLNKHWLKNVKHYMKDKPKPGK
jgi:hypothetical protein